jgi:sec-independent protein translocase protein TatA
MGLSNPIHIAFVLMLLLLVFGARRLPEMGRSLGSGMRGFKDSLTGEGENEALSAPQPEHVVAAADTPAASPLIPHGSEPRTPAA